MTDARWSPEDDQPSRPPSDNPPPPPPGHAPGGYPPPPDTGYGAPGGYPPPGQYGPPGPGYGPPWPGGEDRTWALLAHFGGAALGFITSGLFGWVAPLIAMLAQGNRSPALRAQVVDALNFQILWAAITAAILVFGGCIGIFTLGIGFLSYLLVVAPVVMEVVFGIIAGIKAANGEPYRYPGSPTWVK